MSAGGVPAAGAVSGSARNRLIKTSPSYLEYGGVFYAETKNWCNGRIPTGGSCAALRMQQSRGRRDRRSAEAERQFYHGDDHEHGGADRFRHALPYGRRHVERQLCRAGNSYLKPLTDSGKTVFVANVTFEPGCRNNWHVHRADKGGGQLLICVDGEGWYQEAGKPAQSLKPGDVVTIPAGVKHWHGAKANSWFSHLAVECPGENTSSEWLEPVTDDIYNALED